MISLQLKVINHTFVCKTQHEFEFCSELLF